MLLGAVVEKFECCKFIIYVIGIEFVYVVLAYMNEINEWSIECVFDPLMDIGMIFWWVWGVSLFLFPNLVYFIFEVNFYAILCFFVILFMSKCV